MTSRLLYEIKIEEWQQSIQTFDRGGNWAWIKCDQSIKRRAQSDFVSFLAHHEHFGWIVRTPTSSPETARRRFLCSYLGGWLCCRGLLMWRDLTSNRLDFYIAQNNVDTLQRSRRSAGIRIGHARRSTDPIFLSGKWITKTFVSFSPHLIHNWPVYGE